VTDQNKNSKKICPLLSAFGNDVEFVDCLQEQCAWYSQTAGVCAVKDIINLTDTMVSIHHRLVDGVKIR
jgi:hypothetical protein